MEHVSVSLVGGDGMIPEDTVKRSRFLAKLRSNGCGCSADRVCKHYYANLRSFLSRTERHTEGEHADIGVLEQPLYPDPQTYFAVGQLRMRTAWNKYRSLTRRWKP